MVKRRHNSPTNRQRGLRSMARPYVLERDDYRCQFCYWRFPPEKLTLHHVIPARDGGKTIPSNLITVCFDCHVAYHEQEDKKNRKVKHS